MTQNFISPICKTKKSFLHFPFRKRVFFGQIRVATFSCCNRRDVSCCNRELCLRKRCAAKNHAIWRKNQFKRQEGAHKTSVSVFRKKCWHMCLHMCWHMSVVSQSVVSQSVVSQGVVSQSVVSQSRVLKGLRLCSHPDGNIFEKRHLFFQEPGFHKDCDY